MWISYLIEYSTINVRFMVENKGVLKLDGAIRKGVGGGTDPVMVRFID